MSSSRLAARVGPFRLAGVGRLPDFRHRFNKRGNDGTAKGNVEPATGELVIGVAYELDDAQLAVLDEVELGYRLASLQVCLAGGKEVAALCYRAVVLGEELEPTRAYLEHYVAGAAEHGIPLGYLRAILPPWFALMG